MIADSHCHIHLTAAKNGETVSSVVHRARAKGVRYMLNVAVDLESSCQSVDMAQEYEDVYASVGVHPCYVGGLSYADYDKLLDLAKSDKVVAIGETGLDYHHGLGAKAAQWESLDVHARLARMLSLPLVIHTRDADDDMVRFLASSRCTGVLHCFTGGSKLAVAAVAAGYYISVSGVLTFKSAGSLRDVVKDVPLERLLVETDAPYLAPEPFRGKVNEPALVVQVVEALARIKGRTKSEVISITTENFLRLFRIDPNRGTSQ